MNLRERAMNYLARREHSRAELVQKLSSHGEADAIVSLLDQLEQENLLSNARYAESLAHSRAGRHGSVRLKSELREKGVPETVIAEVVGQAREADLAAARAVWLKKFGQLPSDAKERAKQQRFLLGRGFPSDVARRVLGGEED
ncbi:MAG: recombination regulator RecX [Hydrogenophilales bacterium CG17_big_fil_post_rev_8_21_14_2_50_63_12]|nr:MAG: recombination regulator RecX [Hydrogenophilales bacterium CG17_big_fil_post_rev_8_21_14_2_50_63_12]PIX97832.1 MAG: recombination regulator RecX [Hydrogenophilales bacterium CG_4_10_14_3_um_filter_63_21]PJB05075.1 MAG: recombination regulator RecX [Hydrogenophilales bacterium CG_4_9_14_3_um_filter_63_34]